MTLTASEFQQNQYSAAAESLEGDAWLHFFLITAFFFNGLILKKEKGGKKKLLVFFSKAEKIAKLF